MLFLLLIANVFICLAFQIGLAAARSHSESAFAGESLSLSVYSCNDDIFVVLYSRLFRCYGAFVVARQLLNSRAVFQ